MFDRGYLSLFRIRGVPVRAHWTLPLGLLMFSGGQIAPGLWLGILLVILLHEAGHAFLVRQRGMVNAGIDVHGFGGVCRWVGRPSEKDRAIVAWGGVLAQALLLAVAWPLRLLAPIDAPFVADLLEAFTVTNGIILLFNLVPFGGLDGVRAWPLLGMLWRERQKRREWKDKLGRPPAQPAAPQTLQEALREADERAGRR